MLAFHNRVNLEHVNYIERRQRLVEDQRCVSLASHQLQFLRAHHISNKNSFTSKITSGTPKFQMAILNQEIMIPHPLKQPKYLLIAHGYRNPFYIQWVSYHAIFYLSLAREILKFAFSLRHTRGAWYCGTGTRPRLFSSFVLVSIAQMHCVY